MTSRPDGAATRRALLALPALTAVAPAAAQETGWPSRPVRLVVPYPPGGGTDTMARIAAARLAPRLGQTFVVDNRAGANGAIAADYISRAPADGYTVFFCGNTQTAILPALQPVTYDPERDFAPITIFGSNPAVFAVHPSVPARTLEEFVAHVRANPGRLNYGSAGTGTLTQIAAALWVNRLGLDIVHVPFRGGAQSVTEALAGRVQMLTGVTGDLLPAALNGDLRILATSGAERLPQIPDVPTVAESLPGFVVINWNGVVVHAGTPRPIQDRLSRALMAVVREPEVRERLAALGVTPVGNTPEEMAAHMRQEAPVFRAAAQIPGMRDT